MLYSTDIDWVAEQLHVHVQTVRPIVYGKFVAWIPTTTTYYCAS